MRKPKPYRVEVSRYPFMGAWFWFCREDPDAGRFVATLVEAMDAAYAHARGER